MEISQNNKKTCLYLKIPDDKLSLDRRSKKQINAFNYLGIKITIDENLVKDEETRGQKAAECRSIKRRKFY